ncbi:hypothetical protein POUND7_020658, partial [Theobroma cacao]
CLTCWCPCVTFGQIAEMVDKRCTWWHGNMERKKRMAALPPSIQVGMFR